MLKYLYLFSLRFKSGKYFWFFLIILLIGLLVPSYIEFWIDKNLFRFSYGLLLQLVGILTIVVGISNKLKIFKNRSLFAYAIDYFKSFNVFKKTKTVYSSGTVKISSSLTGKLIDGSDPKHEFEDIIRYIKENVKRLDDRISSVGIKSNERHEALKKSLASFKEQTNYDFKEIKNTIQESNVKDIGLEIFGVACLIYGLILSAFPQFISLLNYHFN